MPTLELRPLTLEDEATFRAAYGAWQAETSQGFIFARGFEPAAPFPAYLALTEDHRAGRNLPVGFVPYSSFFGFVGAELVGMLTIRHELNEFLHRIGGHIGYGVVPPQRRRGYATEMLRQSLPLARDLGISAALVTCDETNEASARTIRRCGGVFENSSDQGPGNPRKSRFWIELKEKV